MKAKLEKWKKPLLFLLLILAVLWLNSRFGWSRWLSDSENFGFLRELIRENMAAAFFLYCLITVVACVVLALPGITFAILAGVLFGPVLGIIACNLACTIGASLAFLAGRFFLKDAVKPMLEKNRLLKKLLFSGSRKNDVTLLMITRLVPLFPYNLQNFAYGVTDMGFWTYTLLTFVFMIPGVSFYTIGAAGLTAGEDAWKYFLAAGMLAVLVTFLGIFIKKRFLTEEGEKQAYVIMTRVPEAGKTKTRLMPFLTGEECKELHEAFLLDMRDLFLRSGEVNTRTEVILYYLASGPDSEERISRLLPGAARYIPQYGEGMGERMKNIFRQLLTEGYRKVVLTGTDIPELSPEIVAGAFAALKEHDMAISPTADGGYYLLGMRRFQDIFSIGAYGTGTVYAETCRNIREKGLSLWEGPALSDLDTPEDIRRIQRDYQAAAETGRKILWRHTAAWLNRPWEDCIGCGLCTKNCSFLEKYGLDLRGLAGRPELFYSCFLCGKCREVCPADIDGRKIALLGRWQEMEGSGALAGDSQAGEKAGKQSPRRAAKRTPGKEYAGLLWEKDPYRFQNYRKGGTSSIFFPGCNLVGFFPKTAERLGELFAERGIGTVYDCCGKPVEELGLLEDAERNLAALSQRLLQSGCKELILACPNCYYYFKERLPREIRLVTVYRKLSELGLGKKLVEGNPLEPGMPVYLPCPDRREQIFWRDLKAFLPETAERETFSGLQCCGLGGCAFLREPELAAEMTERAVETAKKTASQGAREPELYTYCASCVSQFRRKGFAGAKHLLPMILETEEPLPGGGRPFLNRALHRIK